MTKEDILTQPIKVYKSIYDKQGILTTLDKFLFYVANWKKSNILKIREEPDKNIQKEMKKMLPCATLSCFCGNGKNNILGQNKLLCIDIDLADNPHLKSREVLLNTAYRIFNEKWCFCVGRSVSGTGLFVIIVIKDKERFGDYFKRIEQIMLEKHGVKIDGQCCNINRLRFVSYDEKIMNGEWIKDVDVEEFDEVIEVEEDNLFENIEINKENKKFDYDKANSNDNTDLFLNNDLFVVGTVMYLIMKCNYRADDYYSWLMDAFRLSVLGDKYYFLFRQLSRCSKGYKSDEACYKKWQNCLKESKMTRSCLVHYFAEAKRHLGSEWRIKILDFTDQLINEIKEYKNNTI